MLKVLHDAAKAAIEEPVVRGLMKARGVDIDYRSGDKLRQDLWREYKEYGRDPQAPRDDQEVDGRALRPARHRSWRPESVDPGAGPAVRHAARPGAGFYPVLVAVFACLVGVIATVSAFRRAGPRIGAAADAGRRRRAGRVVARRSPPSRLLPRAAVDRLPVSALAFVAIVLLRLGSRWPAALPIARAERGGSHYVFAVLLDVPLPRGPW